jgi:hypothetical protein
MGVLRTLTPLLAALDAAELPAPHRTSAGAIVAPIRYSRTRNRPRQRVALPSDRLHVGAARSAANG